MTQIMYWAAALAGAFVVVRGCFEAPAVRKQVMLVGLLLCGGALTMLLQIEGSPWRWPAGVLMSAATIAAVFAAPRSVLLTVWPKLRWMVVSGIGVMSGIAVLARLSDQLSPVVRAALLVFVAGMIVLFFVSTVGVVTRMAATAFRSAT